MPNHCSLIDKSKGTGHRLKQTMIYLSSLSSLLSKVSLNIKVKSQDRDKLARRLLAIEISRTLELIIKNKAKGLTLQVQDRTKVAVMTQFCMRLSRPQISQVIDKMDSNSSLGEDHRQGMGRLLRNKILISLISFQSKAIRA